MEIVSTKEAADSLGVTVQKVHRVADALGLVPALKLDGRTGAKWWTRNDVEAMRQRLTTADEVSA